MKKMKRFIYVFITLLVFSSCNESPVDLDKAKSEAEAFIESQFDFFSSGNIEDAKVMLDQSKQRLPLTFQLKELDQWR